MKTIAIANQKGGVGKTTTATVLGHFFAEQGKRVLIVDLDSQGHVAVSFGLSPDGGLKKLLVEKRPPADIVQTARPGLDIIPNDHTAETVKAHVMQAAFREYLIASALEGAAYDLIFLDTPPSTDILHISALVASDYLLIPSRMDFLAVESVTKMLHTATSLRHYPNVTPPILLGVLPTMYERVTRETELVVQKLGEVVGAHALLPPIPQDTRFREASHRGMTIWEYDPLARGAIGYRNGKRAQNSRGLIGGYLHTAEIIARLIQ